MVRRRNERPLKRVNPSGATVWVARYTDRHGKRHSAGTFDKRGACREARSDCCAQHAIWAAYEADTGPRGRKTVGGYAATWLDRRPRSDRTDSSYRGRLRQVLDVELDGQRLRDWPLADVRRSHARDLLDHMLRVQGRAAYGAKGILLVLSAMYSDAIDDDEAVGNPFAGVTPRANDPRVQKPPRRIRVWSWDEMHAFCAVAAAPVVRVEDRYGVNEWRRVYAEPMLRVLSDCGLRLGEMLALERRHFHGEMLEVRQTTWRGRVYQGTKTDHGQAQAGREVPVPPALQGMIEGMPARIDTRLLFPTPTGLLFSHENFYRDVWRPTQKVSGMRPTPHEFRHSFVSHMRAGGIDPAKLALACGHTVETATAHYTHAVDSDFGAMRLLVASGSEGR